MKKMFTQLRWIALAGLALATSIGVSHAQALVPNTTYINNFDIGTNTADFAASGSVASWIYWYNTPGTGGGVTNSIENDAFGVSTSGSLLVWSPFLGVPGTQNLFFGTWDNGYGYDTTETANLLLYSNISFYIKVAANTPPRQTGAVTNLTNTDFGNIGVGYFTPYSYVSMGSLTIPLSASNAWVKLSLPIDHTIVGINNTTGIAFDIANYGGYPEFDMTNYIDSLEVDYSSTPPLPPTLQNPVVPTPGLNALASVNGSGGQYNRSQLCTVNDTGYSFVGQSDVTYSWTVTSFPANTGGNFQQHFFIVNGAPGQYDQAADYNLADCLFMTVQQADDGAGGNGMFNFRYKTNEPGGNSMLFNTLSPTNPANTNLWPIMPFVSLTNPGPSGAVGTWSVHFHNTTNITITAPGGGSTNFNLDPASAALFADPASLLVGGQPNNPNGDAQSVVYSSFSATGCASPISDNFLTDPSLNLSIWKFTEANDTNGIFLVPTNAAYWVKWTLPDAGFLLQDKATLGTPGGWTAPTPELLQIRANGLDQALVAHGSLPSATSGYFQLIQFQFTQLQVLLAGETAAPGTLTGKTGTPTAQSGGNEDGANVPVTVNAVDPTWHLVPGVTDVLSFPSSSADPNDIEPNNTAMVNGTASAVWIVTTTSPPSYTITVHDLTAAGGIPDATSAAVVINP
jgi:hypothetical protein